MAGFKTLDDLGDLTGKRVLVRVDLNVPMADGKVTRRHPHRARRADHPRARREGRARSSCSPISAGRRASRPRNSRWRRSRRRWPTIIGRPVAFADDCIGPSGRGRRRGMKDGDVLLLENTRFHKGEEKNDPDFADALAASSATSTSTTPSPPRTAPMPRPRASPTCCPPMPGAPCRPSSRRWKRASATRSARSSPSSAAPRSRPRSTCSRTS